ncbi:MAG: hypothetical protein ABSF18_02925 [Gammaproteobacteria bacterium]|jgi:hypothetical protein
MRKPFLVLLSAVLFANVAHANNREVLAESNSKEDKDSEEVEEMLIEQSILEHLFLDRADITVTPYYDHYGRAGAKVVPNEGEPYYVDPYYDDPMTTNRHSDEPNTGSNWRVFTWGE